MLIPVNVDPRKGKIKIKTHSLLAMRVLARSLQSMRVIHLQVRFKIRKKTKAQEESANVKARDRYHVRSL